MKFKKIISLFVAVMLIVGSMATVSAAIFPDLEDRHSWADEAITSMVNRGILKGYTDGTFKPDRAVSHLETLIIAARIMGVDAAENKEYREFAIKQYESALSAYDIDYKAEVSYLLYCGVLATDELSNYISNSTKNAALQRYEAAVFLTKLVGGEKDALAMDGNVLDFADTQEIPASARPYVKYVYDAGLMNGVGDNYFSPYGELTRAMISTVMYRAEGYMDANVVEGVVESNNGFEIEVTAKGVTDIWEVSDDVLINLDGKSVSLQSLAVGQYVRLHCQGDELRCIDALTSKLYQTVEGTITSLSESSGIKKITLKNSTGTYTYPIAQVGCEYFVNNKVSTYVDIKTNMYATLVIQGGYITKVTVETGSKKITGTLKEVKIDSTAVAIVVTSNDGIDSEYIIGDEISISRNNTKTDIHSLAAGDSVSVVITNGTVDSISATSSTRSMSGTISKIVISASPEVTIKTSTTENVYGVTANTKFTVDGKADCTIYDLRLGAAADVRLDSTNLISITTQSAVSTPTLTGVITYVHPTSYVMGLQIVDPATGETKEIQTVASKDVKITDASSSRITSFKGLQPGMTVVVVGSANYGVYEVAQIIVTVAVN